MQNYLLHDERAVSDSDGLAGSVETVVDSGSPALWRRLIQPTFHPASSISAIKGARSAGGGGEIPR